MANSNPQTEHLTLTQWQPGVSGNPDGKPKGTKHLSTWIRELMEDESFGQRVKGKCKVDGAPIQAIVSTLILKAIAGDMKAFDLLGKYGWGTRLDVTSDNKTLPSPILSGLVVIRDNGTQGEEDTPQAPNPSSC